MMQVCHGMLLMKQLLPAVRAAVNAEVGVTARPMEMQNADLRILNEADGLPRLPDIQYWLYKNADEQKILF